MRLPRSRDLDELTDDNPDRCPLCSCEPESDFSPGDFCESCDEMLLLWQRDQLADWVRELLARGAQ